MPQLSEYQTLPPLELDEDLKEKRLGEKVHELRERFGLDILKTGDEL